MQAIFARGIINQEFGLKGGLPWGHNAKDLAHFKDKTLGKTLLCGKNTYNSLPAAVFKGRTVKMVERGEDIQPFTKKYLDLDYKSNNVYFTNHGERNLHGLFLPVRKIPSSEDIN